MNDRQREVARLTSLGLGADAIARSLGVSVKTIQRDRKNPDVQRAIQRTVDPSIRATLEAALTANRRDGSPDHAIRIQAARALMQLGPEGDEPAAQPTVIVLLGTEDAWRRSRTSARTSATRRRCARG